MRCQNSRRIRKHACTNYSKKSKQRDKAEQNAGRVRKQLLTAMNKIIGEAKRREDAFTVQKKICLG